MSSKIFYLDGDNANYGQEELNFLQKFFFNEGVLNTEGTDWEDWVLNGDLKVTEKGAGADMSVDVAQGVSIIEHLRSAVTFKVFASIIGTENLAITSNSSGVDRVDAIVIRVDRSVDPNALMNNVVTAEVVLGTGVSALSDGAIDTILSGSDWIRLADVTVQDSATSITDSDIADTRIRCKTNDSVTYFPSVLSFNFLTADPSTANLEKGMMWFNSTDNRFRYYDGVAIIDVDETNLPTSDQKDALAGTSGTPDGTNKYVTQNDTSNGALIIDTTIAFVNATSKITDSGNGFIDKGFQVGQTVTVFDTVSNDGDYTIIALTSGEMTVVESLVDESAGTLFKIEAGVIGKVLRLLAPVVYGSSENEASGNIQQYDAVYPTSTGDEVATLIPNSADDVSSVAQAISNTGAPMCFHIGEGVIIEFTGGHENITKDLYAQIRTINSAEDDLTNSSAQAIFNTGSGVRGYNVCKLSDTKFAVIYSKDTTAGFGTACKIVTISGTTISVGTEEAIDTRQDYYIPAIAKLDTDKVLIVHTDISTNDLYTTVLSIVGDVITSNTKVEFDTDATGSNAQVINAQQITIDKVLVVFYDGGGNTLASRVVTVSGTVPTVGASNSLVGGASGFGNTIKLMSETKGVLIYCEAVARDFIAVILTISGDTVTIGSTLELFDGNQLSTVQSGLSLIGEERAVFNIHRNIQQMLVGIIDISGVTPTLITSEIINADATSQSYGCDCVKILPYVYYVSNVATVGDSLYKLNSILVEHFGIANDDIADTVEGTILHRYAVQRGFTGLTAGVQYYVDDNGYYTTEKSTKSIKYGLAINSTTMLLN